MNDLTTSFDVIIVGGGATGAWAAKQLTERGRRCLLLEAGAALHAGPGESARTTTASDSQPQDAGEARKALEARHPIQARCYAFSGSTNELFVDDLDNPYETDSHSEFSWIRLRGTGGRTLLWNRVAVRMSDRQFRSASIDGHGADWPVTLAELAPYYDEIERYFGVHGIPESLEEIPDGCYIPTVFGPAGTAFRKAMEENAADRRVTALRQICLDARRRRDTSPAQNSCSCGTTCATPGGPLTSSLIDAEATGRLTIRPHSHVLSIETSPDGLRATGVAYVDTRSERQYEAHGSVILLCASTIESVRIMLNSSSSAHPAGLGNSSGLLGRNLTTHTMCSSAGVRDGHTDSQVGLYIPNFYNLDARRRGFLRGFAMQGILRPEGPDKTRCDIISFGEMLPRVENGITLSTRRDRWGAPIPQIRCVYSQNELEMAEAQRRELSATLAAAGYEESYIGGPYDPGMSIHEVGTARMGASRRHSVLNPFNQCWDTPNVLVTDGSAFPSAGFQNPTLTMMALTGRACQHLCREFFQH